MRDRERSLGRDFCSTDETDDGLEKAEGRGIVAMRGVAG